MIRTLLTRLNSKRKQLVVGILARTSPVIASRLLHKNKTGRKLNLKDPKLFCDKCHWLKLYWQHPLVVSCADKFEVRSYITQCGHPEILNDQYGVYESTSEIDWEKLPHQFVLKGTHGSNYNIICRDKDALDKREATITMNRWLASTYGVYYV